MYKAITSQKGTKYNKTGGFNKTLYWLNITWDWTMKSEGDSP